MEISDCAAIAVIPTSAPCDKQISNNSSRGVAARCARETRLETCFECLIVVHAHSPVWFVLVLRCLSRNSMRIVLYRQYFFSIILYFFAFLGAGLVVSGFA